MAATRPSYAPSHNYPATVGPLSRSAEELGNVVNSLAKLLAQLKASQVIDDSSVTNGAGSVKAALNVLQVLANTANDLAIIAKSEADTALAEIAALVASSIGNDSSVSGATVKDALDWLKTHGGSGGTVYDVTAQGSPDAHWIMGATPTVDATGHGHTLTAHGTGFIPSPSIDGGSNAAMYINANYNLTLATSSLFVRNDITISAILRVQGAFGDVACIDGPGSGNFAMAMSSNAVGSNGQQSRYFSSNGSITALGYALLLGSVGMYTMSRDATGKIIKHYWNGQLLATTAVATAPTLGSQILTLWGSQTGGSSFVGHAYCQSLWSGTQTDAQVAATAAAHGLT